jgi:hypothetical protein
MDRLTLHAPTLLIAARAVGLAVAAEGDRLSVHGPKGAAGLARLVLDHKPGILAALAAVPEAAVLEVAVPGPPLPDPERVLTMPYKLSATKVSATEHLAAIHEFVARLHEIEAAELARVYPKDAAEPWPLADRWVPGNAILAVLAEAKATDRQRSRLAAALRTIEDRARAYRVALGDDRRSSAIS